MCDTLVALGNSTTNGNVIFGKNSDRHPNEAQLIEYHPSMVYEEGTQLKCTHISIPQIEKTYAVFISRPHWIFGAEMGANEHGVVIGNEAVFSKEEVPETGLLGMDLLRLGLERGKTAREALDVIVSLLETHGQGGVYQLNGVLTYHNSYIIADTKDAWVLETSSRRWVAEKVKSVRSISNGYTIQGKGDMASTDLVDHAISEGWVEDKGSFSFSEAYGHEMMRYITMCDPRFEYTSESLSNTSGNIDFLTMKSILTSHPVGWKPWAQEIPQVCEHTYSGLRDESAGSQISELGDVCIHWFTGSSNPCQSVYWPFKFDNPFIFEGWNKGTEKYSEESYWWRREVVNRKFAFKIDSVKQEIYAYLKGLQADLYEEVQNNLDSNILQRNIIELEKYLEQTVTTAENTQDIDSDYIEYMKGLITEAEIPSELLKDISNLF